MARVRYRLHSGRLVRVYPALRLLVAAAIIVLLIRAARAAWIERRIALTVWRRIRPRHVLGSLVLLAAVLGVALGLMELLPITSVGLGSFIGLTGNAIFAPVEEAAARGGAVTGPQAETAMHLANAGIMTFLVLMLAMFPWLAYVEERVFREGLERAGPVRRYVAALRFGLAHLVMLVPVAAALAISVAGLWYGRVYLAGYRRAAGDELLPAAHARTAGVMDSTVWHTAFNTTLMVLVIAGFATGWL